MKPAFSYYGGKQRMASKIIPLIPKHTVYCEPFAGGLAVLFKKPWPQVKNKDHYREVINDTDGRITNFYKQLRDNPEELIRRCAVTPYSREEYGRASEGTSPDPIEEARRFYIGVQQSFGNKLNGGWRVSVFSRNEAATWARQMEFLLSCAERLLSVHIEHVDALEVIRTWDSPQTFFYCDPPYPGTNQGHYAGYSQADFDQLVAILGHCEGSFLLSCYGFDAPEGWERFDFEAHCSVSGEGKVGPGRDKAKAVTKLGDRKRTEVVYRVVRGDNVRPEIRKLYQLGLFDCFEGGGPGGGDG